MGGNSLEFCFGQANEFIMHLENSVELEDSSDEGEQQGTSDGLTSLHNNISTQSSVGITIVPIMCYE